MVRQWQELFFEALFRDRPVRQPGLRRRGRRTSASRHCTSIAPPTWRPHLTGPARGRRTGPLHVAIDTAANVSRWRRRNRQRRDARSGRRARRDATPTKDATHALPAHSPCAAPRRVARVLGTAERRGFSSRASVGWRNHTDGDRWHPRMTVEGHRTGGLQQQLVKLFTTAPAAAGAAMRIDRSARDGDSVRRRWPSPDGRFCSPAPPVTASDVLAAGGCAAPQPDDAALRRTLRLLAVENLQRTG